MPDASTQSHQSTLLRLFERPVDGRLSAGDLRKKLGLGSKTEPPASEESEADRAIVGLIEEGLIATSGGSKVAHHPRPNASYRLTEKGRHHLRPPKPKLPDELLANQEAFILLQVFRAENQELTRSELNAKLKTVGSMANLEFDVKQAPLTVDYHLASLIEKGCLVEQKRGVSVRYFLEQTRGGKELTSAKQHEAANFTMTGKTLNLLLAAARGTESISLTNPYDRSEESESFEPELAAKSSPIGPQVIAKYVEQLRSGPFAGKDLIPIHEVRRLVSEHHGDQAAGHHAFDPLLMEMRSEGQLELIAISDNRRATSQELDDSIPGMNETIFYIVVA